MEWNQSDVLALAMEKCVMCDGLGLKTAPDGKSKACNCVHRRIFRICFERFKLSMSRKECISRPVLERSGSSDGRLNWGRKDEEYAADFLMVSKRTLDETEYRIFKYHFLLGADWRLCCRKLNLDKGRYFHAVYRIMVKLGRTFSELQPYALYPTHDYFFSTRTTAKPTVMPTRRDSLSDRVPLRTAA